MLLKQYVLKTLVSNVHRLYQVNTEVIYINLKEYFRCEEFHEKTLVENIAKFYLKIRNNYLNKQVSAISGKRGKRQKQIHYLHFQGIWKANDQQTNQRKKTHQNISENLQRNKTNNPILKWQKKPWTKMTFLQPTQLSIANFVCSVKTISSRILCMAVVTAPSIYHFSVNNKNNVVMYGVKFAQVTGLRKWYKLE